MLIYDENTTIQVPLLKKRAVLIILIEYFIIHLYLAYCLIVNQIYLPW